LRVATFTWGVRRRGKRRDVYFQKSKTTTNGDSGNGQQALGRGVDQRERTPKFPRQKQRKAGEGAKEDTVLAGVQRI